MASKYSNLNNVGLTTTFSDMLRWQKERRGKVKDYSFVVPQHPNKVPDFLKENKSLSTITWIGHATFLLQISGLNIITDPVMANIQGFMKRLTPPGLTFDELPQIDVVLISHNHYDHLDFKTIKKLNGDPLFMVPVGLKKLFYRRGLKKVVEFNWWQDKLLNEIKLTFVPAQHWSKRFLMGTNKSHWGGWVIQSSESCIYFVGDSGYFSGFNEIGNQYQIDYCLMPIGAYEPEWFMHNQHVTPEEAIQGYLDAGAKNFIPMHYDSFRLADDTSREALDRLNNEWLRRRLPIEDLKILALGETIKL